MRLADGLLCLRLVYSDLEAAVALVRTAFGGECLPDPTVPIHPPLPDPPPQPEREPNPVAPEAVWDRAPGAGMRRIGDEVFLWQPQTGDVFHLNPIAGAIWQLLESPASARDIAATLCDPFPDQDPSAILHDTRSLVGALVAAGVVLPRKE